MDAGRESRTNAPCRKRPIGDTRHSETQGQDLTRKPQASNQGAAHEWGTRYQRIEQEVHASKQDEGDNTRHRPDVGIRMASWEGARIDST